MDFPFGRRITARLIFITGLLLMFCGAAFLLGSLTGISRISVFLSFLFVIIGSGLAFLAIKLNKRSTYLFFAAFFLLAGFFLFLSALDIIPVAFSRAWPLLSVFSGLALIPSGWHRFGSVRIAYIVPATAFIILGCILLAFSFGVVPFSFSQFLQNWWPLLFVLGGLILVLASLGTKPADSRSGETGKNGEQGR